MGIRVHKVLGYGLTDVKTRKYKIADGRINRESVLLDYDSKAKLDDYIAWLQVKYATDTEKMSHFNMDMWLFKERQDEDWNGWHDKTGAFDPRSLIHHGIEYMLKNVLLVRPLSCKDWQRHDDPIDWIEETMRYRDEKDGLVNWYKVLTDGIFPYSGSYMNARTGDRVKNGVELHRFLSWKDWPGSIDETAKACGFVDEEDARANLVPMVPNEIRDLCEWGKLFTDDTVWRQLRPMIYTYWS